ncbi:hypothetical protein F5Y14DRAFT_360769 [Nemania sp. NC0429]|nr:hypothetical protein F5Y14DRAFT_360769 [Nemania sp. NC0429]
MQTATKQSEIRMPDRRQWGPVGTPAPPRNSWEQRASLSKIASDPIIPYPYESTWSSPKETGTVTSRRSLFNTPSVRVASGNLDSFHLSKPGSFYERIANEVIRETPPPSPSPSRRQNLFSTVTPYTATTRTRTRTPTGLRTPFLSKNASPAQPLLPPPTPFPFPPAVRASPYPALRPHQPRNTVNTHDPRSTKPEAGGPRLKPQPQPQHQPGTKPKAISSQPSTRRGGAPAGPRTHNTPFKTTIPASPSAYTSSPSATGTSFRDPYLISSSSDSESDSAPPPLNSFASFADIPHSPAAASDVDAVLEAFPEWLSSNSNSPSKPQPIRAARPVPRAPALASALRRIARIQTPPVATMTRQDNPGAKHTATTTHTAAAAAAAAATPSPHPASEQPAKRESSPDEHMSLDPNPDEDDKDAVKDEKDEMKTETETESAPPRKKRTRPNQVRDKQDKKTSRHRNRDRKAWRRQQLSRQANGQPVTASG